MDHQGAALKPERRFFTLIILPVILMAALPTGASTTPADALQEFKVTNFAKIERLAAAPAPVQKALREALRGDSMAEPGGRWEPTDVIGNDKLPRRRLILAGNSPSLWFFYYEHGGRGRHEHVVTFKVLPDGEVVLQAVWQMLPRRYRTIDDLKLDLPVPSLPSAPVCR